MIRHGSKVQFILWSTFSTDDLQPHTSVRWSSVSLSPRRSHRLRGPLHRQSLMPQGDAQRTHAGYDRDFLVLRIAGHDTVVGDPLTGQAVETRPHRLTQHLPHPRRPLTRDVAFA